jgi:hypothetical protein
MTPKRVPICPFCDKPCEFPAHRTTFQKGRGLVVTHCPVVTLIVNPMPVR